MDETRTRRQQQEDVVKLVTSSSEKRARLLRLVEERKRSETFFGYAAGSVNENSSKPASKGTNNATAIRGDVKKSVHRHKWIDGVSVDIPVQSKGTNKISNKDSSVGVFERGIDKESPRGPAPTGHESQAGKLAAEVKESERSGQFKSPFFDSTGAFATKARIASIYNPAFTSKIHGPPAHLDPENNAFPDTPVRACISTKPTRPTTILSSPIHGPATVDEAFDVVGTAELDRDDGFDRLELSTLSADNGRSELTFWEDEEDEEEWLEGWDEGGLAEPKVKAGIDGRKGREVRFKSEW